MGHADEIDCQLSSDSEAEGPSETKTSAEASVNFPCRSNDDLGREVSGYLVDQQAETSSPESRGAGPEPGFPPDQDTHDEQAGDAEGALRTQTFHGNPITVSQCIFQAHIGSVSTVAEVRTVSDHVLTATKKEAPFYDCVGPFAYRLTCVGEGEQQMLRNIGVGRHDLERDCDGEEGYCDNGDVGSGEKLLHLLQKWDVRHRVLMVTRIDGGFMRADLMGIRRYKFVIDRAKRLLDSTDLVSLRRAVATDIHPPTTAESNANLTAHDVAMNRRYCSLPGEHHKGGGDGGGCSGTDAQLEDSWDRFVVPLAARRRISGHTAYGDLLGVSRASGGAVILAPRKVGGEGRKGLRARHAKTGGESSRTRERRALSLTQLSISSKTVSFPRGHVPSVMGDKGYGKKRGRINHFAVRTPPTSASGDDDSRNGHAQGGSMESGCDADDNPAAGSFDGVQGLHAKVSGWSLPHELDPTSAVTDPEKRREGNTSNGGWANCSINTTVASRASTCDTINSPSRIAAIMLGVIPRISSDHPLHPPPPAAAAVATGRYHPREIRRTLPSPFTNSPDGSGSSSSQGLCRGVLSRVDTASSSGGMQHCHTRTSAEGGDISGDDAAWPRRGRLPHRPIDGGGGSYLSMTDAAGHERRSVTGSRERIFPSARTRGVEGATATNSKKNSAADSHALPLLHRAPGMCVRDEPPPSLAILTSVGGSGDGYASAAQAAAAGAPAPLSNESMMDRWKSDDDRSSSVGIPAADCGVRAGTEDDEDTSAGDPPQNRAGSAAVPRGRLLGGTIFVPNSDSRISENGERRQSCETPATWGSDDLADLRGMVSGRSDPPPTRSKSAIRGWSVNRAVPACSPLATEERPTAGKK